MTLLGVKKYSYTVLFAGGVLCFLFQEELSKLSALSLHLQSSSVFFPGVKSQQIPILMEPTIHIHSASHTIRIPHGITALRVRRFGDVNATRGEDEVGHHMPQYAYDKKNGISRNDGPALNMSKDDHALTRTYAGRGKKTMVTDAGLTGRQRLYRDVQDVRSNFGTKYNKGLLQLIQYAKSMPDF